MIFVRAKHLFQNFSNSLNFFVKMLRPYQDFMVTCIIKMITTILVRVSIMSENKLTNI